MAVPALKQQVDLEAQSGLESWQRAELPLPPSPVGLGWIGVVGPGVIILGASIGSGEFLLGPAAFVKYGLAILWVTLVATLLQTFFNQELMRYTLATGEPIITGFMRTRPSSTLWAWVYSLLYFIQVGWPAWAAAAAGAFFYLFTERVTTPDDANVSYLISAVLFFSCVGVLLIGRRIERTLELLNWVLVTAILSTFAVLCAMFVAPQTWLSAAAGLFGFDLASGRFAPIPENADFFLLGAFAGYSGAGGVINLTLSNWARDRGYGMGGVTGFIPAAAAGANVERLAHVGATFTPDAEGMKRWNGWWRVIRADQWGVFFAGALIGMIMPAMLYVTFIPTGSDIRGYGIAAALASNMATAEGAVFGVLLATICAWILFKTQLDIFEGTVRSVTDILWTGNARLRAWSGGDVRRIYYVVLAAAVVWGLIALRLAQPVVLLQLSANMGALVFVITGLHVLYVNTRLLPEPLRPSMGRRAALVGLSLFYGVFVSAWLWTLLNA
jgi:hypothetical protein